MSIRDRPVAPSILWSKHARSVGVYTHCRGLHALWFLPITADNGRFDRRFRLGRGPGKLIDVWVRLCGKECPGDKVYTNWPGLHRYDMLKCYTAKCILRCWVSGVWLWMSECLGEFWHSKLTIHSLYTMIDGHAVPGFHICCTDRSISVVVPYP